MLICGHSLAALASAWLGREQLRSLAGQVLRPTFELRSRNPYAFDTCNPGLLRPRRSEISKHSKAKHHNAAHKDNAQDGARFVVTLSPQSSGVDYYV